MSLLEVAGVHTGYGRLPVVRDVSLRVDEKEFVAVIGPNGAGKSSLAKAIFGLLPILSGSVRFDGEDIGPAGPSRRQALGMSMIPQTDNTFADLTVEDNLKVSFSVLDASEAAAAIEGAYSMFPRLEERQKQPAKTLSGGERQMLAFASGIGSDPRFILLDEPTTGLAPTIVQGLVSKIVSFRERGTSILWIVEENPLDVLPFVDRVYVLNSGTIQAEMTAEELLVDGSLRSLFFGVE